jgi:uncharacterized OsmC-like protein
MTTELAIRAVHQGGMRVLAGSGELQVLTDYPLPGGAPQAGLSSLQLLLASLANCSANGLTALLQRDGIQLDRLAVTATGQRRETHPTVLETIHLAFEVAGPGLDPALLERTLELAESRICPVWVMLSAATPITRSLTIL